MASATSMSSGVVIFRLVYSPLVSFTGSPSCSMTETSSVTSRFSSATFLKPFNRFSMLMTCGVCTSQSLDRSMVRWTNKPSSLSLMVALHGTPNTAAPCSLASPTTLQTSSMVTRGRALSWTATNWHFPLDISTSLFRPFSTEPCRSSPGLANSRRPGYRSTIGWYSGWYLGSITRTTFCGGDASPLLLQWSTSFSRNKSSEWCKTGTPRRGRYCLGILAFIRLPVPPASNTNPTSPMFGVLKSASPSAALS
mmetsp:Transcript_30523/g.65499  ORF Transcript_30523/g.65499 Transcript_30523/m.65499 type:complete len:252 (-) Transcript_30523:201-956(-)